MKKSLIILTICTLLICPVSADMPIEAPVTEESVQIASLQTARSVFISNFEHDGSDFMYPEEYAGHWADGEWFHIALTDVSDEMLAKYLDLMQEFASDTIFHEAQYSYAELMEAVDTYLGKITEYTDNVVGWRITEKYNCVALEFVGDPESIHRAIEKSGAPEGLFSVGGKLGVCPMGEIVYQPSASNQTLAIDAYQLLESSLQFAYNGYPDHYAGSWLEGDTLCVGITTEDEGVRSIYLDILAPAKCKIEYRVVKYSYNQLMNFNEIIWSGYAVDPLAEAVTMAGLYGMNSSGILTDKNCVEVTSMQGYSEEFYAALVSFAKSIGADEDIFVLDESAHAIMPATEEAVVEESPVQSPNLAVELPVGLSMNPLIPYFTETYGENVYPNHYAGCWHESTAVLPTSSDENEFGEVSMEMTGSLVLHIMLAEEVDEETLAHYRELCMADAAFISDLDFSVVFDRAEYSYNTLRYIKDEAAARYEARVGTKKYLQATIDENDNRVILRCEEYDDALHAVVDELTEEFGKNTALFEVIETEVVIAEPQAGYKTEQLIVTPQFEVIEEAPADDDADKVTGFYPNPLEEYFFSEYGDGVYPDDYAGCWFSNRFDMHIMLTEDVTEENRLKYMDIASLSHIGVISTETALFSMNDLNRALAELKSRFGDGYGIGKVHGTINEAENRIDLTVNYLNTEHEAILESIASDIGKAEWYRLFAADVPMIEEAEEVVVEEIGAMSVAINENPLIPYFEKTYKNTPDWYAGAWLDGSGTLHIALTLDADEDILEECRAVCGDSVIFETADYSFNQLEAYRDEALRRGREMGLLMSGGIDQYPNKAELYVTPSYGENIPIELTDMLDSLAAEMGLGRDVYILAVSLEPDETAEEIVIEESPEIISYPIAEPQTSPATYDTATPLCLLFSSLSAAGIIIGKHSR